MARVRKTRRRRRGNRRPWRSRLLRWSLGAVLAVCAASVLLVLPWRWLDPPTSSFMLQYRHAAWRAGYDEAPIRHRWRDWAAFSPALPLAVIAAEDQRFAEHHGIDIRAIHAAWRSNRRGGTVRGGSTITQQTVKNLFLWRNKTYLRKGIEAWLTLWAEALWPKRRILEIYLNTAQFGPNVFGAESAARHYHGKAARDLSLHEAALLAAVLPAPSVNDAGAPSPALRERQAWVERQARQLGLDYLDRL